MALCRFTETSRSPYLRHCENFPPMRDEPFYFFLHIAVLDPDGTGCGYVDRRPQGRCGRGKIFQIRRRRYNGRLVRLGTVECRRTESRWRVSCVFRGRFVQGLMWDPTRWVARDNLITSLWVAARCNPTSIPVEGFVL